MSSTAVYKYPKSEWDKNLLEYIGLRTDQLYYKNYVYKCLLTRLQGNYRYGRYELDDDLMNILRANNGQYYYKYASRSGISYMLTKMRNRVGGGESNEVFTISFDENGEELIDLEL